MADNNRAQVNRPSDQESEPNVFQKTGDHLRGKTVGGLMELLPLLITTIVVVVMVNYVDSAVVPILKLITQNDELPTFPGLGLLVAICVFYIVGLIVSTSAGKKSLEWLIELVTHIPVVKGIFNVTRQATTAVTSEFGFSRVVFIEWPRDGMVAMGFVTAEVQAVGRELNDTFVLVYIPTIPNPTSGNMALVPQDDILETDLSVDDAMKLVFSGGIVPPDTFALARLPEMFRESSGFEGAFVTTVSPSVKDASEPDEEDGKEKE